MRQTDLFATPGTLAAPTPFTAFAALAVFTALGCASTTAATPEATSPVPVTGTAGARAPATMTHGTYTIVRANDTIAIERFTRTNASLEADFAASGTSLFHYTAMLTPAASVSSMQVTTNVPGSPTRSASVTFRSDTAILVDRAAAGAGDSASTVRRAVPPGTLPYLNPSPSLMEQIVRRARAVGGTTVSVPLLIAGSGGQTTPATVTFTPPDSARVTVAGVAVMLRVDSTGAVTGGAVPSQGLTISRSITTP